MVARVNTIRSLRTALRYNEEKVQQGRGELILAHGFPKEAGQLLFSEKLNRLHSLALRNPSAERPCLHLSLNFRPGQALTRTDLRRISVSFMERIGLAGQPFLAYRHLDAAHPHIHVVSTPVRRDGKLLPLLLPYVPQTGRLARKWEQSLGLAEPPVPAVRWEPAAQAGPLRPVEYGKAPTAYSIERILSGVLQDFRYTTLDELDAVLQQYNVTVQGSRRYAEADRPRGLMYRILDSEGRQVGVPIRASQLRVPCTFDQLELLFARNRDGRQGPRQRLQGILARALENNRATPYGKDGFLAELAGEEIRLHYGGKTGTAAADLYYVDLRTRTVFSGRDMEPGFSLVNLLADLDLKPDGRAEAFFRMARQLTSPGLGKGQAPSSAGTGPFHSPGLRSLSKRPRSHQKLSR